MARAPIKKIKYIRSFTAALALGFLLMGSVCAAQSHKEKLPDSIQTTVEELAPIADTVPAVAGDKPEASADGVAGNEDSVSGEEVLLPRSVPDSTIRRQKMEKDLAYANDPAYWTEEAPEPPGPFWIWLGRILSSGAFRIFMLAALGSLLLYVLYRIIAENNLRFFYKQPSKKNATGVEEPVSAEEADPEEGLRRALAAGDHRMATRYLYLRTLRLLETKSLIRYHIQYTDQEYVRQMKDHMHGSTFRTLTQLYERIWYGEFPTDHTQFEKVHTYFQEFYKSIGGKV